MNNYNEYVRVLNSGDDDLLVSRFFAFPCTFVTPMGEMVFSTKDECLGVLKSLHRVRECFQLLDYIYVPGKLFAKVDMIFPSTVENLEFHVGPVRPGDVLTRRAFVFYALDPENRLTRVEIMQWPADSKISPRRCLGAFDYQVVILEAFVAGFNAQRFEVVGEYYTENATLEYPPSHRFEGRKEIVDGFIETAKVAKVELGLLDKICDVSGLCLTFNETITAISDAQSFLGRPIKEGDSFSRKIMVIITLEQGLICKSKSILL